MTEASLINFADTCSILETDGSCFFSVHEFWIKYNVDAGSGPVG